MIHTGCLQRLAVAFDAVHLIALAQQKFSEIRAILARDTGDQCFLLRQSVQPE